MARSRDAALRWWRVSVSFHGRTVGEHRFEAGNSVTIGESGDVDVVVPGLPHPSSLLIRNDAPKMVDGLEHIEVGDATLRLRVAAHPAVEIVVAREEGPRVPWSPGRLVPLRELAYGAGALACLAALLFVGDAVGAVPAGGSGGSPGAIERVMLTQGARFAAEPAVPAPVIIVDAETDAAGPADPPPLSAEDSTDSPVGDSEAEAVTSANEHAPPKKPNHEKLRRTSSKRPAKTHDVDPAPMNVPSAEQHGDGGRGARPDGRHSHDASGEVDAGSGGLAAADGVPCDDPEAVPKSHVDVVFVIDVSTTMRFALERLSAEIATLDESLRRYDAEPRYGLAIFVDDVMLVNGGQAYEDVERLRADFEHWARFTATNRQVHAATSNVDWPENTLDALHRAAVGFDWRDADDTLRLVVHATDDDFAEPGTLLSGLAVEHDYEDTVAALKRRSIRVATFTARIGGKCECEDVTPGFLAPYEGRASIPNATGGAAFDIDEIASGRLHFSEAIGALLPNFVCDRP